jgi:hypothetical protein
MRKEAFEWESQNEKHHPPKGINVEPIKNYVLPASLFALSAMSPYSHTMSVPIAAFIKEKKSLRSRKRNKS